MSSYLYNQSDDDLPSSNGPDSGAIGATESEAEFEVEAVDQESIEVPMQVIPLGTEEHPPPIEQPLQEDAERLATFLLNPFETTFTQSYQVDYQDPECLEKLNDDTNELMDTKVDLGMKFIKHIESCSLLYAQIHDEIVESVNKSKQRQPTEQEEKRKEVLNMLKNLDSHLCGGGFKILEEMDGVLTEIEELIKSTSLALNSERHKDFVLKEDIQFQRGLLVAAKDDIVPKISRSLDPTGFCRSFVTFVTNNLVYRSLTRKDRRIKAIDVRKETFAKYLVRVQQMSDEVDGHRSDCRDAANAWFEICSTWNTFYERIQCGLILPIDNFRREASVLDELNKGDIKAFFALLKAPIEDFLAQKSDSSAHERSLSVNRQVAKFYKQVTNFAFLLTQLHTAQAIIAPRHQKKFAKTLLDISAVIRNYLDDFKNLYSNWRPVDIEPQAIFLKQKTWKFARDTGFHLQYIMTALKTKFRNRRSKRAFKRRTQGDRVEKMLHWSQRPLTTSKEVQRVLRWLDGAIRTTYELSVTPSAEESGDLTNGEGIKGHDTGSTRSVVGDQLVTLDSLSKTLSGVLETIFSVSKIIPRGRGRQVFRGDVSTLHTVISNHVTKISELYGRREVPVDQKDRENFIKTETWKFARHTGSLLHDIRSVVEALTDERKKMQDWHIGTPHGDQDSDLEDLATASAAIQQVEDNTEALHALSITLGIEKNRPTFCQSNSPSNFYQIINDELIALKGLEKGRPKAERRRVDVKQFRCLRTRVSLKSRNKGVAFERTYT